MRPYKEVIRILNCKLPEQDTSEFGNAKRLYDEAFYDLLQHMKPLTDKDRVFAMRYFSPHIITRLFQHNGISFACFIDIMLSNMIENEHDSTLLFKTYMTRICKDDSIADPFIEHFPANMESVRRFMILSGIWMAHEKYKPHDAIRRMDIAFEAIVGKMGGWDMVNVYDDLIYLQDEYKFKYLEKYHFLQCPV